MLMQLLQFPFAGDRGQALEEWERLVRQYEGYDALRVERKAVHQAYKQWSMADGNEATPVEIDALAKGKARRTGETTLSFVSQTTWPKILSKLYVKCSK